MFIAADGPIKGLRRRNVIFNGIRRITKYDFSHPIVVWQHEEDIAMAVAALVIGLLIVAQGLVGLVAPEFFLQLIQFIQTPPNIYLASVVRVAFGVVLVLAAPLSRAPIALRILGGLIVLGGLVTPFWGVRLADVILGWWSQGPSIVRAWATGALVLGLFIIYATGFKQSAA